MGQQGNSRMRVATLNYSGIFVSPFEFYAMDNWLQLELMGRIFQANLKADYSAMKTQIKAVAPNMVPAEEFYMRRRFQWKIEDFDKKCKGKRSSPVYIKDAEQIDLATYNYMGIGNQNTLHNEVQFKEEWAAKNKKLYSDQKARTPQEKEKADFELHMCRFFDFECYQAIIMYLFSKPQHAHFFPGERRPNDVLKLDEIINGIKALSPETRAEAIGVYRKYMAHQFKRIDSPFKVQTTVDYLFNKWDLDVVCLQEVDTKLRERLRLNVKYFVFAPADEKEDDQCIILLKKKLPLVPSYFTEHYQEEESAVIEVKTAARRIFSDLQTFQRQRDYLADTIEGHFDPSVSRRIIEKLKRQVNSETFKKYKEETLREIFSELMNPTKGEFDKWVEKYKEAFLEYGQRRAARQKKAKDGDTMKTYLGELKEKGMLFWTEAFILTNFTFSCKRLQGQPRLDQPYIFASLHLSSKQPKNKLQVQLLGIFVYELLVNRYNLVFAGDFNSHIVIGQKENTEDLFAFVREFQGGNEAGLQKLNEIEKSLHIFPKHPLILTTKKKRTIMQVQARKTNLLAEKSIDQIISNIPILLDQCYTGDVKGLGSGKNSNKAFIPHMEHPYDHFIVEAVLNTSQQHP